MDREMDREMDALDMYYDDVHHDIVGDVDFYLSESIKYGSRILEVGCGTGRLLLRFAEQGRAVYGIDNSSIAIDLLERKIEKIEMGIRGLIRYELGDVRHYQSSSVSRMKRWERRTRSRAVPAVSFRGTAPIDRGCEGCGYGFPEQMRWPSKTRVTVH